MLLLHVIILGIVEGITEFLPISSTAHIEFATKLLGIIPTDFVKSFTIVIQLGAILAVVMLYREKLLKSKKAWQNIIVGFVPTGIIGFVLYKIIKHFLLGNVWIAAVMLVIGGIAMVILEKNFSRRGNESFSVKSIEDLSLREMVTLGVIQSLAVIPGVSRSGALVIGGVSMNIPRAVIVETAFLLAIPTMAAATGYDLLKTGISFTGNEWIMLGVGTVVAGAVAFVVAKWLLRYIAKHDFTLFGWYRIIAGIVLLIVFLVIT